jgi:hypothetical protein
MGILYYSMYRLCVYVYKPLPPGVYPIAVDKYINKSIKDAQILRFHLPEMIFTRGAMVEKHCITPFFVQI